MITVVILGPEGWYVHQNTYANLGDEVYAHGGQRLAIPYWGFSWPGMLLSLMVV